MRHQVYIPLISDLNLLEIFAYRREQLGSAQDDLEAVQSELKEKIHLAERTESLLQSAQEQLRTSVAAHHSEQEARIAEQQARAKEQVKYAEQQLHFRNARMDACGNDAVVAQREQLNLVSGLTLWDFVSCLLGAIALLAKIIFVLLTDACT